MSCSGLRSRFLLVVGVVMVVGLASAAFAVCAAPAQSGLAVCFPSVNSTVLYPATIEMAANSGGVPITHVSVYDGGVRVDDLDFIPGQLIDFALTNGFHHVTVNAWDANGKLYQAKSSFTITGFGAGQCASGGGTITLCSPRQASYVPEGSVLVSAAFAKGVKSWSIAVDGKQQISSAQTGQAASGPLETSVQAWAGNHILVVSAVDAKGATSTVTRKFGTFYNGDCNPKSGVCRPGITLTEPGNLGEEVAADVATGFRLQAEVTRNPKPTTKMILYVDGVGKAQSAGPGITANVAETKGSHYVVVLAWDTAGNMYETYGNVNAQ